MTMFIPCVVLMMSAIATELVFRGDAEKDTTWKRMAFFCVLSMTIGAAAYAVFVE